MDLVFWQFIKRNAIPLAIAEFCNKAEITSRSFRKKNFSTICYSTFDSLIYAFCLEVNNDTAFGWNINLSFHKSTRYSSAVLGKRKNSHFITMNVLKLEGVSKNLRVKAHGSV